jgi:hypothetical protein
MNIGKSAYELAYVKSPIFLNDGLASGLPGKVLPLIAITEAASFVAGLLAGQALTRAADLAAGLLTANMKLGLDDFYATFWPLPGSTLHKNQIASYPFANQAVAANAIISQPLNISMRMNCTPRLPGAMVSRIMTATALKNALDNHNFSGGTYSVLTPSFFYIGCILKEMKDITSGDSKHPQTDWQLDFEQPLLSLNVAKYFQGALMSKLTGGVVTGTLWSGVPGL